MPRALAKPARDAMPPPKDSTRDIPTHSRCGSARGIGPTFETIHDDMQALPTPGGEAPLACICKCKQHHHDPRPGLHGCHACRCFAYRPTDAIAEWYRAESDSGGIENPRQACICASCLYDIAAGEYREWLCGHALCMFCATWKLECRWEGQARWKAAASRRGFPWVAY